MKEILDPIMTACKLAESDSSSIADVPEMVTMLHSIREKLTAAEGRVYDDALDRLDEDRFISDAHFLANILHPQYRGRSLVGDDRLRGMDFLNRY